MMETIITQIQQTSMVEWLGTATGLVGVYLSVKGKILAWPLFIVCYGLYAYLSFSAALYAAMALNVCFIPIAVYGWWQWSVSSKAEDADEFSDESLGVARLNRTQLFWMIGIVIVGTITIGGVMTHYTEGAFPYFDAFATCLSFCAQWMLSRKLLENWIAWFVADTVFIMLWGIQGYWVAVAMFIIFTLLAVKGFTSWKKELDRGVVES